MHNIRRATGNGSYLEFDITLLHKLLVNVCKIDGALKEDVKQINELKNKYGHMHINEETKTNFMETWKKYEDICRRMDARTPNQQYLSTLDQLREREAVIIANSEGEGTCSSAKVLTKTAFLLNIWREENKTFYITKGCKKVIKLIRNISIVTITGDQGSGKSAIAHHLALKYQNEGWSVIPIQDIRNMVGHIDFTSSSKQLFVLDDPIGRETISQNCIEDWVELENTLEMFAGKDNFRVLITCRKQILKELNVESLLLANVVSLDGDLQLSNKEKEGILKNHITSNCLKDDEIRAIVLKSSKYFPLLCSIFGGHKEFQKEGVKFFSEPGVIIAKEVHSYKDADKKKWCAFFLLVSNQGICDREINWDEQTFYNACSLCGLPSSTQQRTILEQYNILCGHLLKEEGRFVKFLSEYVMDITTFVFFKEFPSKLIKTCSLQFLCRRVFFVDYTSQEEVSDFSLLLNETTVEFFTDRLLSSLDLNCVEICLCTALRSPMVKHSIKKKLRLMEVNEFEATFLSLVRYNQNIETNEVKSNQSFQEVIQGTMQKLFPNLRPDLPTRKSEEIEVLDIDLDSPVTEVEHDNCALCGITELYERDIQDGEETINVIQGKRKDETFGVKDILINIINNLIPKDSFPEIFSGFIGIIAEFFETPNLIKSFGAAWPKFENKLREILINDVALMKHIELFKAKNVGLFDCCTLK
ncbi:uncharacterized protein LOC134253284 [Saccostrea cucullata]|uniref:uncharacterized protein LOC134253284 n=1 Tax=Saccostrea cuccullata TaxID=36930 RepID=UPI002ECFC914